MENEWYYTQTGASCKTERAGPLGESAFLAMVRDGQVSAQEHCWREGLPDWVRIAQAFPQLVPPEPSEPVAQAAAVPAFAASVEDTQADQERRDQLRASWDADNPYAAPISQADILELGLADNIPPGNLNVKRVSLTLWFMLWGMGWIALLGAGILYGITSNARTTNQYTLTVTYGGIALMSCLCGLLFLAGFAYSTIILHRMWRIIQDDEVRTSPGKAVGFSFIPFFSLYWVFVVYWMWATDYNQFVQRYGMRDAPEVPEKLLMFYAIIRISAVAIPCGSGLLILMVLGAMKTIYAARAINHFHELGDHPSPTNCLNDRLQSEE